MKAIMVTQGHIEMRMMLRKILQMKIKFKIHKNNKI
jgi:hypothetical protein